MNRVHRSTVLQREWGNLLHLHVEKVRRDDPLDGVEDAINRFGVLRRRYPHLEPRQIHAIVRAGLSAEQQAIASMGGVRHAG